jgi:hypothetical protein
VAKDEATGAKGYVYVHDTTFQLTPSYNISTANTLFMSVVCLFRKESEENKWFFGNQNE